MSSNQPDADPRYASRKWILAKWMLTIASGVTVGLVTAKTLGIGDALPPMMDVLQWWSYTAGAVLTLYGGANVVQKGIETKAGGAK